MHPEQEPPLIIDLVTFTVALFVAQFYYFKLLQISPDFF